MGSSKFEKLFGTTITESISSYDIMNGGQRFGQGDLVQTPVIASNNAHDDLMQTLLGKQSVKLMSKDGNASSAGSGYSVAGKYH